MKTFKGLLKTLPDNGIFVFFNDITGKMDRGPAKIAKEHFGAIEGKFSHSMGQSYAIVVKFHDPKDKDMRFMLGQIDTFYRIARRDSDKLFYVMCHDEFNFHNYTTDDMIKAFKSKLIPNNIIWEESFYELLHGKIIKPKIQNDEI